MTWLGRVHVVAEGVVMGEWAYLWGSMHRPDFVAYCITAEVRAGYFFGQLADRSPRNRAEGVETRPTRSSGRRWSGCDLSSGRHAGAGWSRVHARDIPAWMLLVTTRTTLVPEGRKQSALPGSPWRDRAG